VRENNGWGEVYSGTPTVTPMRYTSEDIKHVKTTRMSECMRADRQRLYNFETGQDVSGTISTELAPNEWATLIGGAVGADLATYTFKTLTESMTFTAGASATVVTTSTSWVTAGFAAGMWVKFSGCANAANNNAYLISSIGGAGHKTLTITLDATSIVTETVSATAVGRIFKSGTTLQSWVLEKYFPDHASPSYMGFNGCRVNEWSLRAVAREIITHSFGIVGKRGWSSTTGTATGEWFSGLSPSRGTTYSTAEPITASANVATIYEGGSYPAMAALSNSVREITLNVNNNMRSLPKVSVKTPAGVQPGWHDVTGTMVVYFEDSTLVGKLLNHTATMLRIKATSSTGNGIIVTLPNVRYTGETPTVGGANQDVVVPLNFVAMYDSTAACTIQVDCLGADYTI